MVWHSMRLLVSRKQQGLPCHGVAGIIGELKSVVVASESGSTAVTMLKVAKKAAQYQGMTDNTVTCHFYLASMPPTLPY